MLMETLSRWIGGVNDVLWTYVLVAALLGCAVWFTLRTRGVQFRLLGEMMRVLGESAGSGPEGERHVSSFQAFAVSLASRVGTGNLAGVATAIVVGRPGAVFWMWVIALVGAASAFVESTLAQLYKRRGRDSFIGGPAYYMERGLGRRWMGVLFAVLISVTFGFAFNSVQSNTICAAWEGAFGADHVWVGVVLTALTLLIIFGGIRRIARVSGVIVPIMALGYIVLALGVVLFNLGRLPEVLELIVADAFGWEQTLGGAVGAALMQGIKRGLFSNEAGMGSAPNVAATAHVSHPVKQGLIQTLGVFTDTLVICTCTAFIILFGGVPDASLNGIQLTQAALESEIGPAGGGGRRRGDLPVRLFVDHRQLLLRRSQHPLHHSAAVGADALPAAGRRDGALRIRGDARSGMEPGRCDDGADDAVQSGGDRAAGPSGLPAAGRLHGPEAAGHQKSGLHERPDSRIERQGRVLVAHYSTSRRVTLHRCISRTTAQLTAKAPQAISAMRASAGRPGIRCTRS